jgi:hypothetical protein
LLITRVIREFLSQPTLFVPGFGLTGFGLIRRRKGNISLGGAATFGRDGALCRPVIVAR